MKYGKDFRVEALKLSDKIGVKKAASQLSGTTIRYWDDDFVDYAGNWGNFSEIC